MKKRIEGEPKRIAALPWLTLPAMNSTEQRLFTPGSGATPPALTGREPEQAVRQLRVRCRKKAVVVLLDEAHTLGPKSAGHCSTPGQRVRGEAPFLLVLAGTPGLPAHLGTMNASFWSRLGQGRLGIGLLSEAAAREALVEPLAAHGTGIDPSLMTHVFDHAKPSAPERAHP